MPPKATNWAMYGKMAAAGAICCIGGPALVYWVSPTEEQIFLKYNPDLQRRSLANREGRQQDFDDFVTRLKEYSKSDKPIWEAEAEARQKMRGERLAEQTRLMKEMEERKVEIRKAGQSLVPGGSL